VASTDCSGIVTSGSRLAAATALLFLPPPPTRILEISDADTLHDRERYSMGSSGVCGGGIAGTASSSSSSPTNSKSMLKAPATSLVAFQLFFSIAILIPDQLVQCLCRSLVMVLQVSPRRCRVLIGREARTKHKARGVEPPCYGWQRQAGRRNEGGNTRLTGSWPGLLFYPADRRLCPVLAEDGNASIKYSTRVAVLKRSARSR